MKETINPKIIKFLQKIGWIVLRPILKFFIHYQLETQTDIKKLTSPLIIVSNHTSYLDPPIIGTILPLNSGVYPIYFIAKDTIINAPILGTFLKILGAFAAWRGEGLEKALEEPKKILQAGYSVVFFPQGHRYPNFQIEQGRPGAAALALKTNLSVLPLAILGTANFSWKNFFLRKYRVKVKIGPPFSLKEKFSPFSPSDLHLPTKMMMEEIKKLMEYA